MKGREMTTADSTGSIETAPVGTVPVGHNGARVQVHERAAWAISGGLAILALAVLLAIIIWLLSAGAALISVLPILAFVIIAASLVVVQPGETRVIQFFGRYAGTVRRTGLSWTMPFSTRRGVSVRVRNFETNRLKVNDADGNPVEIASIVVWQVADTSKAVYAVDDYLNFVSVQAESALRHTATTHPYDNPDSSGESLRGSSDTVSAELAKEVAERVALAGVEIIEVRISHLAYAAEIAQAMLRRQQASAVVAARSRIVEGAVGMVEMALNQLGERQIVDLDDERKAAMVSNLMVVLCGDQPASPIVNAGTLY
jgi:regulator of protease activity HflC (stomatin/prohibitin superfamily)